MAKLINDDSGDEVELSDGSTIRDACENLGVVFACSDGICGTCMINVVEGKDNLSPLTKEEENLFGGISDEDRLACQCLINSGQVRFRLPC
jgi:ferredoxin